MHPLWPPALVSAVAAAAGVPIGSMRCGTVPLTANSESMYNAVAQYAAMSRGDDSPVVVDDVDRPLWERQGLPFKTEEEEDLEDDNDNASIPSEFDPKDNNNDDDTMSYRSGSSPMDNTSGDIMERPVFTLGSGVTEVVWPPPAHLTAEALREYELELRKGRSLETCNNFPPTAAPARDGDDAAAAAAADDDDEVERDVFYIVVYAFERGVQSSQFGQYNVFREMAIFSKTGSVRSMLRGVLEWNQARIPDVERLSGNWLLLYRLKVEDCGTRWESEGSKRSRSPDSVVLPRGTMDDLLSDMEAFLSRDTRKWYSEHGIPLRRAYLFHGPPGTGKTSTVRVMASTFGRSCCFVTVTSNLFSNQNLADALSSHRLPPNALLVLEDVDALFARRDATASAGGLTFSGILNLLDGVLAIDNVITVMTTNHIDRLDEALLRGGRVDKTVHFGEPDDEQLERYFKSFYAEADDDTTRRFVERVSARQEKNARMLSTLQQLFIATRGKSAVECVDEVDRFFESSTAAMNGYMNGDAEKDETEEKDKEVELAREKAEGRVDTDEVMPKQQEINS